MQEVHHHCRPHQPPLPTALTIGGSDSSGGAGIQADLKTFTACGVYGASAISALTVQNTLGVSGVVLTEPGFLMKQIRAVLMDLPVAAVKTGMLATRKLIQTVAETIKLDNAQPLVVDPVMLAKGGDALVDDDAIDAMVEHLLPLAAVATPNRHEAARILGRQLALADPDDWLFAAREICEKTGAASCVVKGAKVGHEAVDAFFDGRNARLLKTHWTQTRALHGSGCTFSAAICAKLAMGEPLDAAVWQAKQFVTRAIASPTNLGGGIGPVNVLAGPE
ncbi:MAG: bifunctional hydroxymethylpyrimidine kinase/phosphomethylpyrimidine kinase [Phycisphaerae bacterium]